MVRAILAVMLFIFAPVAVLAASCDGYDVKSFLMDSPYLLNRMTVVEDRGTSGLSLVHDDDPGISVSIDLSAVDYRPVVRRSEFLEMVAKQQDENISSLEREGRLQIEGGVYPYDPITWFVSSVDVTRNSWLGEMRTAVSQNCDLLISWEASTSPALEGRVQEFRAAIDVLRSFASRHVDIPLFLKENTSPHGIFAFLTGLAAPLLAAASLGYVLSNMRLLPRPGTGARTLLVASALAAGGSMFLHLSAMGDSLQPFIVFLLIFLACTVVACLLAAMFPLQVLSLAGFCLTLVAGLTFGSATYMDWLLGVGIGYGTAFSLLLLGMIGLWSWQYFEVTRVRRRTTRSV